MGQLEGKIDQKKSGPMVGDFFLKKKQGTGLIYII